MIEKGNPARLAEINRFLNGELTSGVVKQSIERAKAGRSRRGPRAPARTGVSEPRPVKERFLNTGFYADIAQNSQ